MKNCVGPLPRYPGAHKKRSSQPLGLRRACDQLPERAAYWLLPIVWLRERRGVVDLAFLRRQNWYHFCR